MMTIERARHRPACADTRLGVASPAWRDSRRVSFGARLRASRVRCSSAGCRSALDLPFEAFGIHVGSTGHLHLRSDDLIDLIDRYGSPLHVVDGLRLDAIAAGSMATTANPNLPGCDFYYSYKTNPVPAVLVRLHALGVGAEVISAYELWLALELGVPPDRIIYNGPAKSSDSIRTAVERGVKLVNANSVSDVERIATLAAEVGNRVTLGVRVSLPGMWGGQFGITSDLDVAASLIHSANADERVDLAGLHFHRGNTLRTRDDLTGHVTQVLEFVDAISDRTGWYPRILDLGGSLACATVAGFDAREYRLNRFIGSDLRPPDPSATIDLPTASVTAAGLVHDHAARRGERPPEVILEPGRSMTANTQFLLSSVVDVKTDAELPHAVLDVGINLAETAANEYHQLFSVSDPEGTADRPYRLVGPICTPADVIYYNWRLPELHRGDVLAIMDTGAYFVPFSTSFSFPRPAIVMSDHDGVRTVRERETFEDLIRLDSWSDHDEG